MHHFPCRDFKISKWLTKGMNRNLAGPLLYRNSSDSLAVLCASVHISMYVCAHTYVCACMSMHICTCMCAHVCLCTYIRVCVCMYVYAHIYAYVCTCIFLHICMCTCEVRGQVQVLFLRDCQCFICLAGCLKTILHCVCVYVWYEHVCMCACQGACVELRRQPAGVSSFLFSGVYLGIVLRLSGLVWLQVPVPGEPPHRSPPCFYEIGSLTDLELTKKSRLVGQGPWNPPVSAFLWRL